MLYLAAGHCIGLGYDRPICWRARPVAAGTPVVIAEKPTRTERLYRRRATGSCTALTLTLQDNYRLNTVPPLAYM